MYSPDAADEARLAEHLYLAFERHNGSDPEAARRLWNGTGRDSTLVRKAWRRNAREALAATFPRPSRGQPATTVGDVIDAIRRHLPTLHAYLDPTGGNCASIRVDLAGGGYVHINDEDVLTYDGGESQPFGGGLAVAVYAGDGDEEPRHHGSELEPSPAEVADVVARIAAHAACPPQVHDRSVDPSLTGEEQNRDDEGRLACNHCAAATFYCDTTHDYHHVDPTVEPCFLIP